MACGSPRYARPTEGRLENRVYEYLLLRVDGRALSDASAATEPDRNL